MISKEAFHESFLGADICSDILWEGNATWLPMDFRLLTELVDFLAGAPPDPDPLTTTYERLQALHRFVTFAERWNVDFGRPELIHERPVAADELAYYGDREGVNRARHLDRIDDEAIAELAAAL